MTPVVCWLVMLIGAVLKGSAVLWLILRVSFFELKILIYYFLIPALDKNLLYFKTIYHESVRKITNMYVVENRNRWHLLPFLSECVCTFVIHIWHFGTLSRCMLQVYKASFFFVGWGNFRLPWIRHIVDVVLRQQLLFGGN